MGLKRGAYLKRGANYTAWATMIRCVRPDQSSATVRLHYLADGGVNFAFTMRKAEYFIPVGVLLKCFVEVRDDDRSPCHAALLLGWHRRPNFGWQLHRRATSWLTALSSSSITWDLQKYSVRLAADVCPMQQCCSILDTSVVLSADKMFLPAV